MGARRMERWRFILGSLDVGATDIGVDRLCKSARWSEFFSDPATHNRLSALLKAGTPAHAGGQPGLAQFSVRRDSGCRALLPFEDRRDVGRLLGIVTRWRLPAQLAANASESLAQIGVGAAGVAEGGIEYRFHGTSGTRSGRRAASAVPPGPPAGCPRVRHKRQQDLCQGTPGFGPADLTRAPPNP